jgi:hypothetical protein
MRRPRDTANFRARPRVRLDHDGYDGSSAAPVMHAGKILLRIARRRRYRRGE